MSDQPKPPACIAEAMLACYGKRMTDSERAQAVWNALLAKGDIRVEGRAFDLPAWHGPQREVLVIPLEPA